jgi:hypothetical protein
MPYPDFPRVQKIIDVGHSELWDYPLALEYRFYLMAGPRLQT